MSTPNEVNQLSETRRDWRYYLGLFLFVLSLILPILTFIIVPLLGLSPGISTVLYGLSVAGGPDVILIGAAALLGKENLEFLFSKLGSWFKRLVKWDQVSARRYRTGVWMFWIGIVISLAFFYFLPETLREGNQPGWGFYVSVGADILFIISFFVLGAEFWGKLGALFQYNARDVVED